MTEYKKVKRIKRWDISRTDTHTTYLLVSDNGDFTIGEVYGEEYHCILTVRGDDVKQIINILSDSQSFEFPELKEEEQNAD